MVSKLEMSLYTSQFGKQVLVLIIQLRQTSLLNGVTTPLSTLNPTNSTKQ